jgi:hypothetical protein
MDTVAIDDDKIIGVRSFRKITCVSEHVAQLDYKAQFLK